MEQTKDVTLFLVQEHLLHHGMVDTLRSFTKELNMKEIISPSPDIWYTFTTNVAMNALKQEFPHEVSSLVALIHFAIEERTKLLRAKTPALIRISQKCRLKSSHSVQGLIRPKSACIPSSASAPTLTPHKQVQKVNNQEELEKKQSPPKPQQSIPAFPRLKVLDIIRNQPELPNALKTSTCVPAQSPKWIPDNQRAKQVRRGLTQIQEELKAQGTVDRVNKHNGVGKIKPPRPVELVVIPCKLCLHPFRKCNLPHRVPYKAIMDLRRSWDPSLEEINPTMAHPPTCYDTVRICMFCSQFLLSCEKYRPTSKPTAKKVAIDDSVEHAKDDKNCNDPFACDPIMDWEDEITSDRSTARKSLVVGQVGMNVRYNLQNAHTVRNLTQNEWSVIHPKQREEIKKHHSAAECLSPRNMKQLLMEATRLAPLNNQAIDRRHGTLPDRRHTTDEHNIRHGHG